MNKLRFGRTSVAIAAAVFVLILAMPGWAQVFSQNPDFNGAFASQNDVNGQGNFATTYDDFTLGASATLNKITWVGSFFNPSTHGNITAWTVDFWSNSGNAPGSLLSSFTTSGNAGETFLQNDNLGDPTYSYTLAISFAATGGTRYWVSVVPDLVVPPQWGWETSSQGNGVAYQCFFGSCGNISADMAYSLYAQQTTVPEPSSMLLLGSGVLGLAGVIRRKLI